MLSNGNGCFTQRLFIRSQKHFSVRTDYIILFLFCQKLSVKEILVKRYAEFLCDGAEVIVGYGLAYAFSAGKHLNIYLGGLFYRVHKSEGDVKIRTGAEKSVMRPDRRVKLFHNLAGGKRYIGAARHHPLNNAHAAGEYNRTFGGALP